MIALYSLFVYFPFMEKITQKAIAEFLGVSQAFLSDLKHKRRTFSLRTAIRISERTGLDLQKIVKLSGEDFLRAVSRTMPQMQANVSAELAHNTMRKNHEEIHR